MQHSLNSRPLDWKPRSCEPPGTVRYVRRRARVSVESDVRLLTACAVGCSLQLTGSPTLSQACISLRRPRLPRLPHRCSPSAPRPRDSTVSKSQPGSVSLAAAAPAIAGEGAAVWHARAHHGAARGWQNQSHPTPRAAPTRLQREAVAAQHGRCKYEAGLPTDLAAVEALSAQKWRIGRTSASASRKKTT